MTEMKILRGLTPAQYYALYRNGGYCPCGCGTKIDLSRFECSPAEVRDDVPADLLNEVVDELSALGAPKELIDLFKEMKRRQSEKQAPPKQEEPSVKQDMSVVFSTGGASKVTDEPASGDKSDPQMTPTPSKPSDPRGNYMHLFSGGKYYPFAPAPEDVDIEDIAHSLATKARYNGHTRFPFWVAQHCCYAAVYDVQGFNRPEHRLARLLHDASEAYNGDLIRPLKFSPDFAKPFKAVERLNEKIIFERFGLPYPMQRHVKIADEALAAAEYKQLLTFKPDVVFDNPLHDDSVVAPFEFTEWSWQNAKFNFLSLFRKHTMDRYSTAPDAYFESDEYRDTLLTTLK